MKGEIRMKKFIAALLAVLVAATSAAAYPPPPPPRRYGPPPPPPPPHHHRHPHDYCDDAAIFGGLAVGLMIGALASSQQDQAAAREAEQQRVFEREAAEVREAARKLAEAQSVNVTEIISKLGPDHALEDLDNYWQAHGQPTLQDVNRPPRTLKIAGVSPNMRLPYALDRSDDDLTLKQIAESGIDFLMDKKKDGFFFMLEGGRIDWSCHSNDAAPMIAEVIDMDEAVKVAYEFYKQHPDETLIVITADHETGGLVLGRGPYELHLDVLQNQRQTVGTFTKMVDELRKEKGDNLQWEDVKALLTKGFGFWDKVKLSDKQTARLQKVFDKMKAGDSKDTKSMYARQDELANTAKDILAEIALVGWQSGGHSNGYVPVFAIGAGAEQFHGRMDNTMIPKIIAKSAGWNL